MYRAVALWALRAGIDPDDAHRLGPLARAARIEFRGGAVLLNGEDVSAEIRRPEVTEAASKVSASPGVRQAMREEQRRIGLENSVVMEGRDIGTVVFPEAQVKIYLDAEAAELARRDHRDRSRREAPLTQAPDAEYIDSTHLSPEQVEEAILKIIRARISN